MTISPASKLHPRKIWGVLVVVLIMCLGNGQIGYGSDETASSAITIEPKLCPDNYSVRYRGTGRGEYTAKEIEDTVAGPNFATHYIDSIQGEFERVGGVHYKGTSYRCAVFDDPTTCAEAPPGWLQKENLFSCFKFINPRGAVEVKRMPDELIAGIKARCFEWTTDSGDYTLNHHVCLHPDYAILLRRNNLQAESFSTTPISEDFFESLVFPSKNRAKDTFLKE